VSAAEAGVAPVLTGSFGVLPGAVATPLALVLTELLQNALQHGLSRPAPRPSAGRLEVHALRWPQQLTVTVSDNGAGLPPDFDLDSSSSLGLQIVRTLVVAELGGKLEITPRDGGGTMVTVDLPMELPQPTALLPDGSAPVPVPAPQAGS
jgi:two-component sensor histidine kinase